MVTVSSHLSGTPELPLSCCSQPLLMQIKCLRVVAPSFVAGAEVIYYRGASTWGEIAPILRQIIRGMTVNQFMQFLDGTGLRIGWKYSWI